MAWNLSYGPWEGAAWFEKMKAGMQDYLKRESVHGQLFSALFPGLCKDAGVLPVGGLKQQELVLQGLEGHEAFDRKGPRTTLKRWFSWAAVAHFHDRCWHS
eukprot:1680277-Lingulodinium_polyedra.AAC.1